MAVVDVTAPVATAPAVHVHVTHWLTPGELPTWDAFLLMLAYAFHSLRGEGAKSFAIRVSGELLLHLDKLTSGRPVPRTFTTSDGAEVPLILTIRRGLVLSVEGA